MFIFRPGGNHHGPENHAHNENDQKLIQLLLKQTKKIPQQTNQLQLVVCLFSYSSFMTRKTNFNTRKRQKYNKKKKKKKQHHKSQPPSDHKRDAQSLLTRTVKQNIRDANVDIEKFHKIIFTSVQLSTIRSDILTINISNMNQILLFIQFFSRFVFLCFILCICVCKNDWQTQRSSVFSISS